MDKIRNLIKLLEESGISEISIEEEGVKITVRKGPLTIVESPGEVVETGSEFKSVEATPSAEGRAPGRKEILSPMVGTFYRAPASDADPFVEEGDVVEKGQTVCMIEAMKLMNEIAADEKGRIVKILAENAQPVEYGQPLFQFEPIS
jgi:acetyl-CoA carboxylase biotin carboxyl carrier protein